MRAVLEKNKQLSGLGTYLPETAAKLSNYSVERNATRNLYILFNHSKEAKGPLKNFLLPTTKEEALNGSAIAMRGV